MSAENRAFERSAPGTGPAPVYMSKVTSYRPAFQHMTEGWRRETPPIVENLGITPILEASAGKPNAGPPPSILWSDPMYSGDTGGVSIKDSYFKVGAGYGGCWYNVEEFGPDCEFYLIFESGHDFYPHVRIKNPGLTNMSGYAAEFYNGANPAVILLKIVGNDYIPISGDIPLSRNLRAGEELKLRTIGSKISAYIDGKLIVSVIDSTYATSGFVGVDASNNCTFRDMGGGTITVANPDLSEPYEHIVAKQGREDNRGQS